MRDAILELGTKCPDMISRQIAVGRSVVVVAPSGETSGRLVVGGEIGTGCDAIYGDLRWISLEKRIIEKKLVFAGRVASLEPER